jgi:hypothetical protein
MSTIKQSYLDGECPDCGEPILDNATEGEGCLNCGHVFWRRKMILTLDITKVTILVGQGADQIYLQTTEDAPFPAVSDQPLGISFEVVAGGGYRYVTEVLKIDEEYIETINLSDFTPHFSKDKE